jgi:hypothetical protein
VGGIKVFTCVGALEHAPRNRTALATAQAAKDRCRLWTGNFTNRLPQFSPLGRLLVREKIMEPDAVVSN